MKRAAIVLALGLGLFSYGCAGPNTAALDASGKQITKDTGGAKQITKDTVVRCPKCGVEFSVGQGMPAEMNR